MCQLWQTDPGAPLEEYDDVLAANLRAALALTLAPDEDEATDEAARHQALVERARAAGNRGGVTYG